MLLKHKSPSLPRNLALRTFGELLIVFSIKVNLLYLLYSTDQKCCLLHLIKQNYLLKTSKNSNLDDSGVSLPVFPSRTNLKLHNISITPKMVKKVITNLDSSKASGPDCVPVVVLKNCEPELSYILAELFSMFLKESCFGRSHWRSPYLRMLGKGLLLKTSALLVFFLWLVKSLKNLQILGLLITLRNMAFIFQVWF